MKFVALLSGGKDSVFNLMKCVAYGHELVCVANLYPETMQTLVGTKRTAHEKESQVESQDNLTSQELDSFMYQTVGVEIVPAIAECLGVPLIRRAIKGKSLNQEMYYEKQDHNTSNHESPTDEVEDLFELLQEVKTQFPEVQAVASGAIFSNYQRLRVENVAQRLKLMSLSYLWLRNQTELLDEMIVNHLDARIIKICSMGLKDAHLGKSITELQSMFQSMESKFGFNVCGEGGEYESAVFDCPLFKQKRIQLTESKIFQLDTNEQAPVSFLSMQKLDIVEKDEATIQEQTEAFDQLVKQVAQRMDHRVYDHGNDLITHDVEQQVEMNFEEEVKVDFSMDNESNFYYSDLVRVSAISDKQDVPEKEQLVMILDHLQSELQKRGMTLRENAIQVAFYVPDMATFAPLNAIYVTYFGLMPPVRVCVEIPSKEICIQLIACKKDLIKEKRKNLHVQSISPWAPANIGPYSQANRFDSLMFMAGQIGMDPGSLAVYKSLRAQQEQTLFNFDTVTKEVCNKEAIETCLRAKVFLSSKANFDVVQEALREKFQGIPVVVVRVNNLPKYALIEVEMFLHADKESNNTHLFTQGSNTEFSEISSSLPADHQNILEVYRKANSQIKPITTSANLVVRQLPVLEAFDLQTGKPLTYTMESVAFNTLK